MLSGIHMMLAARLDIPALALDAKEAETLGKAIAEVQKHYPLAMLDPVVLAWFNLAAVIAKIEAPRAMLVMREAKKKDAKVNVSPAG